MKRRLRTIVAALILILGFFAVFAGFSIKNGAKELNLAANSFENQDLDGTKKHLVSAKGNFTLAQKSLVIFTPFKFVPILGWYVADAQNGVQAIVSGVEAGQKFADALTPYADILGLKGNGNFLGGTAQERLAKVVEALAKVTPEMDSIAQNLTQTKNSLDKIQSWRYPNFLPGRPGEKIALLQQSVGDIQSLMVNAKPFLSALPDIMGQNRERKYLVLFQNNAELRATGGFLTAYALFRVNKGVITSEGSSDIYKLDEQLLKKVPAPAPILKYLPDVHTLNIRDSNLSPDYKASMEQFENLYDSTIDKKDIDGIIALDTDLVVSLMKVLGPIDAYDTKFTTDIVKECNCPQVIYELERYADEPVGYDKGSRKDIIGVLMQEMMTKAFNAPKSQWPLLLGAGLKSLHEKHLLLYFHDPADQTAIEKINFGGRVYEFPGDYLYINETNFAGAKSNLFVQEKVTQKINKDKNGNIHKVLTLEYKYPRKGDNCSLERQGGLCLAGIYRDWIRIYVPKGSVLNSSRGTISKFATSEDLEKTVFDGFFELRPEGALKITVDYTIPQKAGNKYQLLIQKQPGTEDSEYVINAFGKNVEPFPLNTDKLLTVKL